MWRFDAGSATTRNRCEYLVLYRCPSVVLLAALLRPDDDCRRIALIGIVQPSAPTSPVMDRTYQHADQALWYRAGTAWLLPGGAQQATCLLPMLLQNRYPCCVLTGWAMIMVHADRCPCVRHQNCYLCLFQTWATILHSSACMTVAHVQRPDMGNDLARLAQHDCCLRYSRVLSRTVAHQQT